MPGKQTVQEREDGSDELTQEEFFERVALEGVTLDGSFYMPHGTGKQRRFHEYDPGLVKGFDSVREDGETVGQKVANHDEAETDQVGKDTLADAVYPKVRDGFGTFGLAQIESSAGEPGPDETGFDFDPEDAEELMDTIRENHDETGFFAKDDDGEEKVVSLAHPDGRPMGYITGSHVGSLPWDDLSSVDDYRHAVFQALEGTDDPLGVLPGPGDVPIAPDELMETCYEAGQKIRDDEETREKLSNQVSARWEDGEYDHLRDDGDDDSDDDSDDGAASE